MENFSLLDYLKKNDPAKKERLDLLRYELEQRVYYYGRHFKNPKEQTGGFFQTLRARLKYFFKNIYAFYLLSGAPRRTGAKTIISNAYFSVNERLSVAGLNVLQPLHNSCSRRTVGNLRILKKFIALDRKIRVGDFNELLTDKFLKELDIFTDHLTDYYKSINVDALIVPNDIAFFEQLNIRIFKKLGKPSFVFLHGLPGRYNIYDENQTDYLIVWSEKIKQQYIKTGFNPAKILVSGHPFYENLPAGSLRYGLEDVLVISKSLNGAPHRDGVRLTDRGGLIVYLDQIKDTLRVLGAKGARLRVHPSEDIAWYLKFIDRDFFTADNEPLPDSLKKSSLVIGPTSTVFLEAIYYGVNYLIYEPTINGLDLTGYPPVPPFDGLDPKVPVAFNEADLKRLLTEKNLVDKTIFNDYIDTPFNIRGVIDLIK